MCNQQLIQIRSQLVMNDSQQEGFQEPVVQTVLQFILKSEVRKNRPGNIQLKLKPALCVHYQLSLFQYPQQIDEISSIVEEERLGPTSNDVFATILKKQESVQLSEYFPRNYQCLYNKFEEKLVFKRDLTLIIRNVTRMVRDEQVNTFDSYRGSPTSDLQFSSDFECGNLHFVFKDRKQQTYYLLLQNDVNTHGFNFWFFFNVRSATPKKCTFIVVNLSRPVCFQKDVSILTYSNNTKRIERKVGFMGGISQFCRSDAQQNYWSLLFEYQFDYDSDIYFSLTLPYSYSKVIKFLKGFNESNIKNHSLYIDAVSKSPLGNIIPMIRIQKQHRNNKKLILITARQHPCETVGSFICESIIKKLCQKNNLSDALLQRFRFLILPMINVDGVIHGNSRTNLMGYDLNRSWDRSGIIQSIECEQIWKYLQSIQKEGKIIWSFDLHGHSREHGFFAYFSEESQKSLIMTHLLAKNSMFRPNKCVYEIGSSKKQSIRGQLYQKMRIKNAVTIEISLFGSYDKDQKFFHFQSSHFDEIGNSILQSLLQIQRLTEKRLFKQKNWQQIIQKGKTYENDKEIDSDSNPQGDYLKKQQRNQVQQLGKNQQKYKSQSRQSLANKKYDSEQKRCKTQLSQHKKCSSQRASPIRPHIPIKNQIKRHELFKGPQIKSKFQKNQIFNITFTNRFRSDRCVIQSHEFYSEPKVANIWYEQKQQQKQFKLFPAKIQKDHLQTQNLKKSLDMRRRIKFAFQSKHKTQRETYISNLIGPQNITKIKAIVYPTIKEKQKHDLQSNLRSKRQLTKELRNQSYGISLQPSRFQNSFYLKGKNP